MNLKATKTHDNLKAAFAGESQDLERENEQKTSAVHFVRFELSEAVMDDLNGGAALAIGVDHPAYAFTLSAVAEATRKALLADLSKA